MPLVIGGGLPGVGIGVIWIPHYPAVAPTRVAACPVAPKKDSLLCKEVTVRGVPLVGRGKPSLGAHKAKQPTGRALTQRGTTQRRPAR